MELKTYQDYNAMSSAAADMIIDCVRKKPQALLCFATGDTPRLTYQILAENSKRDKIDFSKCFMIGLDEWLGISPDNTGTCHHFLHTWLLQPLSIDPSQIHLFDGLTPNEEEECERMNNLITKKGPIDFMVVGVGMNGHIGFNEPGTDIESLAHVAILDHTTRTVGKKYFRDDVQINRGITLGLKQVMQAETLLMIANGKKKAPVIKQAVSEKISNSFPASLIQRHSNAILMTDNEAASELEILQT
ncbi:MAG: glucosamine-6-phosphate deaminase [Chitinophagaceae bacterium]|nr:glucosamine-6-phosphate deaminase [Chitinophagaceae bacterium]